MSKNKKIFIGILTVLPLVFLVLYFITFISMFVGISSTISTGDADGLPTFIGSFVTAFLMIILTIIISFSMLIYYIIHIVNNKQFDSNQRLVWILVTVFAGIIGSCIYWYLHIWKLKDKNEIPTLKDL